MQAKKDVHSQDRKLTKSLVCLNSKPRATDPKAYPDLAKQISYVKKVFTKMMAQLFLPKFERVEQEVLRDKRFFIIEQRQTPAYLAFFEALHVEVNKDPTLGYTGKSRLELEAGLKNVKIGIKPEPRYMDPLARSGVRGASRTQASNVFVKKRTSMAPNDTSERNENSSHGIQDSSGKNSGFHPKTEGDLARQAKGATPACYSMRNIGVKPFKPPTVGSTREVQVNKALTQSKVDLDKTLKIESSANSKKNNSIKGPKENRMLAANTRRAETHEANLVKAPAEFNLDGSDLTLNCLSLLQLARAESNDEDDGGSDQSASFLIQPKKKQVPDFFDEDEELQQGGSYESSEERKKKLSAGGDSGLRVGEKRMDKVAPAFVLPDQDQTMRIFPSDCIVDEEVEEFVPKKVVASGPKKPVDRNVLGNLELYHSEFSQVNTIPKKLVEFNASYDPLPDIEALEKILLQREEVVRQEHFLTTKEQIMDKAKKFLPENSRTLELFSQSRSADADILLDSMRHSLNSKIAELDKAHAAARVDFPEFDVERDLPEIRGRPFQPSKLCLLAFHTVSKKDVIRGMSPESLSADMAKLFVVFTYVQMDHPSFEAVEKMKKVDLLSGVCDFYLAQLEQKSDSNVSRCNALSLPEKMKLEEFLDANKGVFRVVSDVNLNSFYMSVAFQVFEVLFFYGFRRLVIFLEKRKDRDMSRRNAGFELKYLLEKREFYERKLRDLNELERELHTYNGWSDKN